MGVQIFSGRGEVKINGSIAGRDLRIAPNSCKTCRFWHTIPNTDKWGMCERLAPNKGKDVVLFVPTEALIRTSENFGCNQHQPQE